MKKVIYAHDVIDFTTVAVEFCRFIEQSQGLSRRDFTSTMLKLIPMLYLKAQLLPRVESNGDFLPAPQVTEADYNWVRTTVWQIMGPQDEYLDIAYEEALQTDEQQWKSIAEAIADVYQPLRNFLATYQAGIEDCMHDALWQLTDDFELYWGQNLVDVLRRLHHLRYAPNATTEPEEE